MLKKKKRKTNSYLQVRRLIRLVYLFNKSFSSQTSKQLLIDGERHVTVLNLFFLPSIAIQCVKEAAKSIIIFNLVAAKDHKENLR